MKVNHHTTTIVPVNDEYAAIVGKAIYIFAYYEWTIIYIINHFSAGFVAEYSRPTNPMPSGTVKKKLREIIDQSAFPFSTVTQNEMDSCFNQLDELIEKRNALIHAHPITDSDGTQILAYQTKPKPPKTISEMLWPKTRVEELIQEIDAAAVEAGKVLNKLK